MRRIIFFLLVLLTAAPSYAAWFIAYPQATGDTKKISDDPYEFKLGNMSCGVTKTLFMRAPNDSIIESRELYCWTSEDTYVSTATNCNIPYYKTQALTIKKGENHYMPTLICGPEKKTP
jgi:hypothetical protein